MTNFYSNQKEYEERGIDYDLHACLKYNSQKEFSVDDIKKVWAVWEGENDGDDWRWVLQLKNDRFVFLQGGCDYTGWDCVSWAESTFAETAEKAATEAVEDENQTVYESLADQIKAGKVETWSEATSKEFTTVNVKLAPGELELVRLRSFMYAEWSNTLLMKAGATWEECVEISFTEITDRVKHDLYIVGRVPFHQEDAYTLGLKVGDVL